MLLTRFPICSLLPIHRLWSRKIPQAKEQLSPGATATEPVCCNYQSWCTAATKPVHPEPVLCNKGSRCSEKPMHRI